MKTPQNNSKSLVACAAMLHAFAFSLSAQDSELVLRYDKPADRWEQEALPIGNGQMGAMLFGGIQRERIQFNEESLWVGDERDTGAYQAFGDVFVMFGDNPKWPIVSSPSEQANSLNETVAVSCDGDTSSGVGWNITNVSAFPVIWEAMIPAGQKTPLNIYALKFSEKDTERAPKAWKFLGSRDGKAWTLLDEQKDVPLQTKWPFSHERKFVNDTIYSHYRFEFLETQGGKSFKIEEIQLGAIPLTLYSDLPREDDKDDPVTQYRRELDIGRAIHTVSYERQGVKYKREAFASHPAKAVIVRFTADTPGTLTGTVLLTDMHKGHVTVNGNRLISSGNLAGWTYWPGWKPYQLALNYEAQMQVINDGGTVQADGEKIVFRNANVITLILCAGTDFVQDRSRVWKGDLPKAKVAERLATATRRGWDALLAEHVKDYQALFNRVSLELGKSPDAALPTNERLDRYKTSNAGDPGLEAMLFQYGRYLMIASSRKGGLPANLQGKWNKSNTPPWRCDYHTDINVQMNYWPVEVANLSECFVPYIDWVESIREVLTERALKERGNRGWVMGAESGLFGGTTVMGYLGTSSWLLMNSYEHYLFTRDKEYLRSRAYPAMKEVCDYWFDSLIQQSDGTLVTPESHSPEHGSKDIAVSFDRQMVWELFNNTIEASTSLGVDPELRQKLTDMKARILPPAIGSWGQLLEWKEELKDPSMVSEGGQVDTPANRHRHISHLLAVFPGRQITVSKTPALAEAARVSLNARGDEGATGWSKAHKLNLWARLQDGDRAYGIIRHMLKEGNILPNLFGNHAPFQIDANFGYTAGVCEMLAQSHLDEIHLLPALPKVWSTGSVKGLRARGGFEVDVEWREGKLVQAVVRGVSNGSGTCTVRYGQKTETVEILRGNEKRLTASDF